MGKVELNNNNNSNNKGKMNFPKMENFVHRYTIESLTVLAIIVAALSSWAHFFVGTFGLSMLFLVLGSIAGIFFPGQMDVAMRKVYALPGRGKVPVIVAEVVKILIALLLPFVYFALLGVMAGTAFQYYIENTHIGGTRGK